MPVVDVEGVGKVEFPDSMSRAQIDAAIRNEILPAVARAQTTAVPISEAAAAPNPFSKGTARADPNWKVGDRYRYRVVDLLTGLETVESRGGLVEAVTDSEVIYRNGRVTDLLGNTHKLPNGQTFTGNQIFIAEYSVGRRWTTAYRGTRGPGGGKGGKHGKGNPRGDLQPEEWSFDFKVVDRESITVPAGTFNAFKVEGQGFSKDTGVSYRIRYWIAPDRVRAFIVHEMTQRNRGGRYTVTDRTELVEYKQR